MPPKRKGAKAKAAEASGTAITGSEALQLKQALDGGNQLDDHTLLTLLKADTPCEGLYSKACKGKGGNPNCLCHLIPAPDAHRRSGLWAKSSEAVANLGPDPSAVRRESSAKPAGLRNLGNTCYVNSVLQCLHANTTFREAVYSAAPPLSEQPIVAELREVFLQMQYGAADPVDPTPLATALQLDHAVQQDGQEFMKLFLTLLEARFLQQPQLHGVIQGLFRGESGYETVCQACHRPSASSARRNPFYELDVPVQGFQSVEESLSSLLAPELLDGDNQYHCEYCAGKRDATRQLRVHALPPLLALSLQRFVFDFQRLDRVKVTDKFGFPMCIKAGQLMGQEGQGQGQGQGQGGEDVYDLEAILIHKGGSAMHGHYVAHIKLGADASGAGGEWWRFDDENVTKMEAGPLSSSDHGAGTGAGTSKKTPAGSAGKRKQGRPAKGRTKRTKGGEEGVATEANASADDSEFDPGEAAPGGGGGQGRGGGARGRGKGKAAAARQQQLQDGGNKAGAVAGDAAQACDAAAQQAQHIVSSNAYMLLYRQRGAALGGVPLTEDAQQWLAEARERLAGEYDQRCATYTSALADLESGRTARRQEVRSIVEAAAEMTPDDPGRLVSSEWLQSWADADTDAPPPPVDNSPLLCPHGKLDPGKAPQAARRISTHAWAQLQGSCRGGPELSPADTCPACLKDALDAVVAAEDSVAARQRYLAVAAAIEAAEGEGEGEEEGSDGGGMGVGAPAYYVAKTWLGAWQKRSGRSVGITTPTHAITCPHDGLAPETLTKQAKRVAIPADFWAFLQRSWAASQAEQRRKQRQRAEATATEKGGAGAWSPMTAVAVAAAAAAEEGEAGDAGVTSGEVQGFLGEVGGSAEGEVVVVEEDQPETLTLSDSSAEGAGRSTANQAASVKSHVAANSPTSARSQAPSEAAAARGGSTGEVQQGVDAAERAADEAEETPLAEFPCNMQPCALCVAAMYEAASLHRGLHTRREAERSELQHLLAPGLLQLEPGGAYRLVPGAFMAQWRAYMAQAGGRRGEGTTPGTVVPPPSLAAATAALLCSCHPAANGTAGGGGSFNEDKDKERKGDGRGDQCITGSGPLLAFPPPAVVNRRGRWVVADADAAGPAGGEGREGEPGFEVVLPSDWEALVGHYLEDGLPLGVQGIAATLRVADSGAHAAIGAAPSGVTAAGAAGKEDDEVVDLVSGVQSTEDAKTEAVKAAPTDSPGPRKTLGGSRAGGSSRGLTARAWLETVPAVCSFTVAARDAEAKAARLTYAREEVMVECVAAEEDAVAAAAAAVAAGGADAPGGVPGAVAGLGERKSKRARKGRAPIVVDSSTSLADLKLRIFEAIGVHPRNARVFARGRELPTEQEGEVTLGQCEIYPGEELKVVDTKIHDSDDVAGLFSSPGGKGGKAKGREAERGFTGTALTGLQLPIDGGGGGGGGDSAADGDGEADDVAMEDAAA